jgi:hypothetical protein
VDPGRALLAGAALGLEAVNHYESNVINTCAQAAQVIKDVGAGNVVVHLDVYHANIEENSIAQAVADCGDHLGYVHVGESHRGYLGTGSADLDGLFQALRQAGYSGTVTFQVKQRAGDDEDQADVAAEDLGDGGREVDHVTDHAQRRQKPGNQAGPQGAQEERSEREPRLANLVRHCSLPAARQVRERGLPRGR